MVSSTSTPETPPVIAAVAWSFSLSIKPACNPLNFPFSGGFALLLPLASSPPRHGSENPPSPLGLGGGGGGDIPSRSLMASMVARRTLQLPEVTMALLVAVTTARPVTRRVKDSLNRDRSKHTFDYKLYM